MEEEKVEEKIEVVKKPYSKEKIGVTVMLVGLTAAIFLAIGYWAGTESTELSEESEVTPVVTATVTPTVTAATSATNETAGWKTATLKDLNLSFKYPVSWGTYEIAKDEPATEPVKVTGHSVLLDFQNEEIFSVGYSTTDFSAPRHGRYYEIVNNLNSLISCSKIEETEQSGFVSDCTSVPAKTGAGGFVYKSSFFGDENASGFVATGNAQYPYLAFAIKYSQSNMSDLAEVIKSIEEAK